MYGANHDGKPPPKKSLGESCMEIALISPPPHLLANVLSIGFLFGAMNMLPRNWWWIGRAFCDLIDLVPPSLGSVGKHIFGLPSLVFPLFPPSKPARRSFFPSDKVISPFRQTALEAALGGRKETGDGSENTGRRRRRHLFDILSPRNVGLFWSRIMQCFAGKLNRNSGSGVSHLPA